MNAPFDVGHLRRYRSLIDDWPSFVEACHRPLPTTLWANPLRTRPAALRQILQRLGIELEPIAWLPGAFEVREQPETVRIGRTWAFLAGLYHVQEAVSMIPPHVLAPEPSLRTLDLCAAPGNKTAQISVAMGNMGTVVANDPFISRVQALRQNLERLGAMNVSVTRWNGASYPNSAGSFDRVLVDAPCSCEGTMRKNPTVMASVDRETIEGRAMLQRELVSRAAHLLAPGGRMVYSTCTFAPEENEAVMDSLLRSRDDLAVVDVREHLPRLRTSPGLTEWEGVPFRDDLRHALRIWPHQQDTGGFFVTVLEKHPGGFARAGERGSGVRSAPHGQRWLQRILDRFGMEPGVFDDVRLIARRSEGLHAVAHDHVPPLAPEPEVIGMFFMRTQPDYPKLTTSAATLFGGAATRNIVALDTPQLAAYLARDDVHLRADQVRRVTDDGYVIVAHRDHPLGVGVWLANRRDRAGRSGVLVSQYPKNLSPHVPEEG